MKIMQTVENISAKMLRAPLERIEQTEIVRILEQKLASGEIISASGEKILPHLNKLKKHLPGILGLWITGFYAQSLLTNKEIPKERKTPLFINNLFCGAVGSGAGYYVSAAMNKFNKHFVPRFEDVLKNQKVSTDRIKELKGALTHSIIPLIAFSFAFRYVAPVVATPLADKVNKFLIKHNLIKDPKAKPSTSLDKFNIWNSGLSKSNFETMSLQKLINK